MALQTTYSELPAIGQVGRRVNMEEWNTITRTLETGNVGFAQPVQRGTGDHGCVIFSAGTFLGLTEADPTKAHTVPDRFEPLDSVPIMRSGVIWAVALSACSDGNLVYWNAATGKYTNTSAGNVLIPNAEFETSATALDQLVAIRLNVVPHAATA